MNKTQVRIIGWSLILLGLFLLSSVILKSIDAESFIAADPIFYIGFILIVAGIVVLAGGILKTENQLKRKKGMNKREILEIIRINLIQRFLSKSLIY